MCIKGKRLGSPALIRLLVCVPLHIKQQGTQRPHLFFTTNKRILMGTTDLHG